MSKKLSNAASVQQYFGPDTALAILIEIALTETLTNEVSSTRKNTILELIQNDFVCTSYAKKGNYILRPKGRKCLATSFDVLAKAMSKQVSR